MPIPEVPALPTPKYAISAIKRAILQNAAQNSLHCTKPHPYLPPKNFSHKRHPKRVREIQQSASSNSDNEFFLGSVEITAPCPPQIDTIGDSDAQADQNTTVDSGPTLYQWEINLSTNGTNVTYKIDTGSQAIVLPLSTYKSLKQPKLHKSKARLTAYNGSPIAEAGKCTAFIRHKGQSTPILFIVTDTSTTPILGLESSSRLNLIKRINSIDSACTSDYLQEFQDCFSELGNLPMPYHIVTDTSIPPVIDAC